MEFDQRLKEIVGLDCTVDFQFILQNPSPSQDFLEKRLVSEAVVSSITLLDNSVSLPCAVDYAKKKGKTGEATFDRLTSAIKILQACENCQQRTSSRRHILDDVIICKSKCDECYNSKEVCLDCR